MNVARKSTCFVLVPLDEAYALIEENSLVHTFGQMYHPCRTLAHGIVAPRVVLFHRMWKTGTSVLIDELLTYLFDAQPHLLAPPMAAWMASSRRFTTFTTTFRDKIRKKVRATHDRESILDLRLELETAYLLLQERPFRLMYEPQHRGHGRGPDFAVTFTTSLTFMVEVTRIRSVLTSTAANNQPHPPAALPQTVCTTKTIGERLADTVCSKLGQLPLHHSNVLLIVVDAPRLTQQDLHAAMRNVQQAAERNAATVVQRHGFRDRSDFFHHYHRLSELVVRGPELQAGEAVHVWVNPQAKYPLPSKVRTVLYRSHEV